jgi:hypothetical protein
MEGFPMGKEPKRTNNGAEEPPEAATDESQNLTAGEPSTPEDLEAEEPPEAATDESQNLTAGEPSTPEDLEAEEPPEAATDESQNLTAGERENLRTILGAILPGLKVSPQMAQFIQRTPAAAQLVMNFYHNYNQERHANIQLQLEVEKQNAAIEQAATDAEKRFDLEKQRLERQFGLERTRWETEEKLRSEVDSLNARLRYTNDRVRSIILYLVVLALVTTPLVAMGLFHTTAEEFSQYIAPITGIAGTVLGYWFGRSESPK